MRREAPVSDAEVLLAVHEGAVAARIERTGERLTLRYEPDWRSRGPFPLSLSLPLASREHDSARVHAFLSNLLPDNAAVLESWGKRFRVSSRSPFKLLTHVGQDCAGAFAFLPPEALEAHRSQPGKVRWLDEAEIEDRLATLRTDAGSWRRDDDEGQFSLAGAQAKIALLAQDGRWGIPSGRTPTTHILKPAIPGFDGHVENEHFCLVLARELGLSTARSEVGRFGAESAIVVERYDRAVDVTHGQPPRVVRLHQEDLCQALGVRPERKYQNDGGPIVPEIAALLRARSRDASGDLERFRDALLFQWLIAGTDAHAKNYSLVHGAGGRVQLAPLYDVASALPYPHLNAPKRKLAMKMGRTYRLRDIGRAEIEQMAADLGLDRRVTVDRAGELAAHLPAAARSVQVRRVAGTQNPFVEALRAKLEARAAQCASRLDGPGATA
ncbi:MAG: type II toxin-antitoxin system HipA family toxin [Sandaracinaceae bacterium]